MNKDKFIFTPEELIKAIDERILHCDHNREGYHSTLSYKALLSAKEKIENKKRSIGIEEFISSTFLTQIELEQVVKAIAGENFCLVTALLFRTIEESKKESLRVFKESFGI